MDKDLIDKIVLECSDTVLKLGIQQFAESLNNLNIDTSDFLEHKELILKISGLLLCESQSMAAKTISLVLSSVLDNCE